jgi:hypothetical protein
MDETKYIQGFNNGYILAGHKPDLVETLSTSIGTANEYVEGLKDGKEQLKFEKTTENLNELEILRNMHQDREHELGMGG